MELSPRLRYGIGRGSSQNQILKYAAIFFLTLAAGLAINAARLMFFGKISTQATGSSETPQVLGASAVKTQPAPSFQMTEYKVQKGDTLFNISQKFNINWTTLATLNNLKSPFVLKPGQIIKVPK